MKAIVSKSGIEIVAYSPEEWATDRQEAEERAQLDSLIPTSEAIEQAEFAIQMITLLQEVGLL